VTNEEYNDELLHIIRENMKTVDSINSRVHSLEAMWKTKKVEKINAIATLNICFLPSISWKC